MGLEQGRVFDLLVVGGGVNGAGIARDAAGRGLSVVLVEQGDLASGTSSASSKLVHGGLRYLEHYAFRLVRESLAEREVLLSIAPHIIRPMTFVLPHDEGRRPAWMIRAGLFLYDHLAPRTRLPASRRLDLSKDAFGRALRPGFARGFAYADCWVDDSRLVVLNAVDAAERGAEIRTRCRFVHATAEADHWSATVEDEMAGPRTLRARVIVNAAGPWVERVLRSGFERDAPARLRLVQGSHIVVPRRYEGAHAFVIQNADKRVVFLVPYEGDFTLVGTTEVAFEGDPARAAITPAEIDYLCAAANRVLRDPIRPADVVFSYAGVRPLHDSGDAAAASAVTRDYAFGIEADAGGPPVLSVYGGKITTYRRLAEHALEKLAPFVSGRRGSWTGAAPLPGGDLPGADFERFLADVQRRYPWLPAGLARRLARAYGTRIFRLLGDARALSDLGRDLGRGLTEREVAYLVETEWARGAEDILWRRSKLGLHGGSALTERLARHLERKTSARSVL